MGADRVRAWADTTVNTVLLDASLPFMTLGRSDVVGVVGSAGFAWRTRKGVSIFGSAEAIGFSDQNAVGGAKGGVRAVTTSGIGPYIDQANACVRF